MLRTSKILFEGKKASHEGNVVSAVSAALFGSVGLISLVYRVYKKIKFELSLGARYSDRMMGVPSPITVPPKEPEEAPALPRVRGFFIPPARQLLDGARLTLHQSLPRSLCRTVSLH